MATGLLQAFAFAMTARLDDAQRVRAGGHLSLFGHLLVLRVDDLDNLRHIDLGGVVGHRDLFDLAIGLGIHDAGELLYLTGKLDESANSEGVRHAAYQNLLFCIHNGLPLSTFVARSTSSGQAFVLYQF